MKQLIVKQLEDDKWSPEIISKIGHRTGECPISHEWIYQWIWASKHGNKKITNNSTSTLGTENEGVNGEIKKIIGVLFSIGYLLNIVQLLCLKESD